ncbi:MAG: efflux RND transporter periplasmic adaptor subunit, partial [Flavobacteriaceae bacterium]
ATPRLRLITLPAMYAEAQLPETYIKNIRVGTPTRIELPMLDKQVDTQIQTIGNFINPGNRTFRVEAPLANPDGLIKPNLMGKMNINDYSNPEALMVPQRVIRESTTGEPYVFMLQPTDEENVFTTQKQFVVLGKSSDEKTEILAGLQAGDRIVIEGVSSLEDGQKVRNLNR